MMSPAAGRPGRARETVTKLAGLAIQNHGGVIGDGRLKTHIESMVEF